MEKSLLFVDCKDSNNHVNRPSSPLQRWQYVQVRQGYESLYQENCQDLWRQISEVVENQVLS